MKKLALIVGLLSMIASSAHAFSYSTPNVFGGYNYYGDVVVTDYSDKVRHLDLIVTWGCRRGFMSEVVVRGAKPQIHQPELID